MDIKSVIKRKGFSIVETAKLLNLSQVRLTAILRSEDLKISTLRKIAKVLNCDIADFFADEIEECDCPNSSATLTCPHCGKPIHIKAEK